MKRLWQGTRFQTTHWPGGAALAGGIALLLFIIGLAVGSGAPVAHAATPDTLRLAAATVVPKAPTGLTLTAPTPYAIEGSFTQVGTNATQFRVKRWTGYYWELYKWITPTGGNGTVYRFSYATKPEQGETFAVCAANAAGEACTDYKGIKTPAALKLTAPANFALSAPTAYAISGSFSQVGTAANRFRVYRWTGAKWVVYSELPATRGAGAGYTFTYATQPVQGETFMVCAVDAGGKEACTDYKGIETPPAPPANVVARGYNQTQVKLTWQWIGGTSAFVQRWDGSAWKTMVQAAAGATSATVDVSALADDAYYFRVCAGSKSGDQCSDTVTQGKQFDHPKNFTQLDYGIYWFRCGTCRVSTRKGDNGWNSDAAKAVSGLSTEYFDPSKPTLIYVHGWEKDTVKDQFRESMKSPTTDEDMLKSWKDRGWNVGIFYWNQFSDDDWGLVPNDTEPKIWTATDQVGMRYKVYDGNGGWKWGGSVKQTAADLFYASYRQAMSGCTGSDIRIVGHSLGNQMAVRMVKILSDSNPPAKLIPKRVALLDPYYTQDSKYWLPNRTTTYNMVASFIAELKQKHNILFEYYKSSGITPEPMEVIRKTVYTRIHPNYADVGHGAHVAAIHWYFKTIDWNLGTLDSAGRKWGFAPSSAMSNDDLRKLQTCGCYFWQRDPGTHTKNVDDDSFDLKKW